MEINAISQSCQQSKERQGWIVQIPDTFGVKALCIRSLIKLVNNLRYSMHRRCLRTFYPLCLNNPQYSPFLCITFRQSYKLRLPFPINPNSGRALITSNPTLVNISNFTIVCLYFPPISTFLNDINKAAWFNLSYNLGFRISRHTHIGITIRIFNIIIWV